MDIGPVGGYRSPSYPTQGILAEHPELLRLVPERWRRNRLVVAGFGLACSLLLAGCPPPRERQAEGKEAHALVAPVLIHGEGFGAVGGTGALLGDFRTEEEARSLIIAEARAAGVELGPDTGPPVHITVAAKPPYEEMGHGPDATTAASVRADIAFAPDLATSDGRVRVEFISTPDTEAWPRSDSVIGTVTFYPYRLVAESASQGLRSANVEGVYGVFYDPCTTMAKAVQHSHGMDEERADEVDWAHVVGSISQTQMDRLRAWAEYGRSHADTAYHLTEPRVLSFVEAVKAGEAGGPLYRGLSDRERSELIRCIDGHWTDYDAAAVQDTAKYLLREQVKDFIQWLKAEGVI